MRAGRYIINQNGRPRLYDHAKIRDLILEGKNNQTIHEETGCSIANILKLKNKWGLTRREDVEYPGML